MTRATAGWHGAEREAGGAGAAERATRGLGAWARAYVNGLY